MESDATDRRGSGSRGPSPMRWLVVTALIAVSPAYDLYAAGTVAWPWLILGVVSWAVALGPVGSRFGPRVGNRFESIGVLGRSVAVLGFAGGVVVLLARVDPPSVPADSFALGGLVGTALVVFRRSGRPDR